MFVIKYVYPIHKKVLSNFIVVFAYLKTNLCENNLTILDKTKHTNDRVFSTRD